MSKGNAGGDTEATPKKRSMLVQAIVFLVITAIAAASGFGVSLFLEPSKPMASMAADGKAGMDTHAKPDGHDAGNTEGEHGSEAEGAPGGYARPLEPILTNLASPAGTWVRMELAVVAEKDAPDELVEQIHQDLFAYMRTVKLHHVEGPSGFINLRAELNERASIRSEGRVKRVLIRTLLFE